jgi:hypothetical protein
MQRPQKRAPHDPADTVTVTANEQLVKELEVLLKELMAKIPRLQLPHPKTAKLVKTHRSVPREFINTMIAIVGDSEQLASLGTFDASAGLEAMQFLDAFRPLRAQVASLLSAINYTMEVRKAEVAAQALQTYDIIKALNRDKKHRLNAHVEHLRRDMHRSGRRKGTKKAE